MPKTREVDSSWKSRPTIEGAGVHLKRALGPGEAKLADPFLLLDDFHSKDPADYTAGFPWHPHRGIETVTYVINGLIEHGDSIGNKGAIGSGDVQWMTAGGGILHQEMPQAYDGMMQGFQLWVNLPASEKMMRPRYRDVKSSQIPEVATADGASVKVVAGEVEGTKGPVRDLVVESEYLDVSIRPGKSFYHDIRKGNTAFAYVFGGEGRFGNNEKRVSGPEELVLFKDGDKVEAKAGKDGIRFLLVSGNPLDEPIAWGGPIVMNTEEELDAAFRELREGTFIRKI
jgi:redox-sensitive bicupin YhaK (pirin superfamily)